MNRAIRQFVVSPRAYRFLLDLVPRGVTRDGIVIEQHLREGRFQRSLAVLTAFSALLSGLEVLYEHYRGSYSQRVMYSPVLLSPLLAVAGIWGALDRRAARTVLPLASVLTLINGLVGLGFHIRGIARKPGGWRLPVFNLVMGPPLLAPVLFSLSGYLGLLAAALRREDSPTTGLELPRARWAAFLPGSLRGEGLALDQRIREGRFQKQLAVVAALSALFSGFEALYSHYKNNFRYPAQWTPVVLTPLIAFAGFGTLWSPRLARTLLPLASALAMLDGGIGFFYHARGALRRPGGYRLPLYNLIYGPPIFAPLLFAASGFLGLLASLLRRAER